ncbi:MAG: hypothetical protein WDM76_09340 [Limisphaerales bacterium]
MDSEEKINSFQPTLDKMIGGGPRDIGKSEGAALSFQSKRMIVSAKSNFLTWRVLVCLLLSLWGGLGLAADDKSLPVRVACVGDSITFGAGISDWQRDSYPHNSANFWAEL